MNRQDAARLERLIATVKLHHPVFGALLAEWRAMDESLELTVTGRVPDRSEPSREITTHEPTRILVKLVVSIQIGRVLRLPDHAARMLLASELRDALIAAASHEIDEMIMVNGTREFDPHRHDEDRKLRALGA